MFSAQLTRWLRILTIPRIYRMAEGCRADTYHAVGVESLPVALLLKWRLGAKVVFDSLECDHYTVAAVYRGCRRRPSAR